MADPLIVWNIYLTRSILPILSVVGIFGNLINILVLSGPRLRHYACSKYFLALSTNNLFYSIFVITYRLSSDGYQYDLANHSIISCKILFYLINICSALSPHFLVLASIDRYWISSSNVDRRHLSTTRMARILITFVIIFFTFLYLSTPILIDIQNDSLGCRIRPNHLYNQIYVIIQLLFFAVIAPSLLTIFGILTIFNTQHRSLLPTVRGRRRKTETQLVRMLLLQVGAHMILTLPISIASIILILPSVFPVTPRMGLLLVTFRIPLHLSYSITSIIYFLSAHLYRHQLLKLLKKTRSFFRSTQIYPNNSSERN